MRYEHHITLEKTIIQDDRFFKLSQDSLLLSDFAPEQKGRILDLGCGVGVLMILMLLKSPRAHALGLEITEGACELARLNLKKCGLETQGGVLECDIRLMPKRLYGYFDCCISNPPYFSPSRGFSSQKSAMAAARNESCGDIMDVCRAAFYALKWRGIFHVCYPAKRLCDLTEALSANRLEPKRMRFVYTSPEKPPYLVLLSAVKGGGRHLEVMAPLLVTKDSFAASPGPFEHYRHPYSKQEK